MRTDATRSPSAAPRFATSKHAVRHAVGTICGHPAAAPAVAATLAGGALACVWTQWTLRFGGDPATTFGGRAAVLCGLVAAWAIGRRRAVPLAVAGPLLAAAAALTPLCLLAAEATIAAAPAGWLAGGRGTVWLTLAGLAALGPAAFTAGLLGLGRGHAGVRIAAAAGGVAAFGLCLAPAVGLQNAALAAAFGALLTAGVATLLSSTGTGTAPIEDGPTSTGSFAPSAVAVALCGGALVAAGLRAAAAYFPLTIEIALGRAALAAAGLGAGLLIAGRLRRDRRAIVGGTIAAVGTAAAFALGSAWVGWNLWANATAESPTLLTLLRTLCAAAFLLPACVGAGVAGRAGGDRGGASVLFFAAGLLIGGALLTAAPDGAVLIGTLAVTAAVTAVAALRGVAFERRPRIAVAVAATTAALCVTQWNRPPADAEKTLFGVLPALAWQGGVSGRTLVHLDDARERVRVQTSRGAVTLFREQGTLLTVRHNGLPEAAMALQPALAPRDTAATLRAVLPLCWVEAPNRVLLLGTSSSAVADAVTRFPVREIVACDGRPNAVAAVRDELKRGRAVDPFADDRVALLSLDPPLAVRSAELRDAARFDVVIADPPHPGTADAAAEESTAYAARIAGLLTDDGVACRRVRTIDCGPAALAAAAATWRTAFAEVRCVEVGRGEFALLGTNAAAGLQDTRLGVRADHRHVRELMAECGWDWSVPLNLIAVAPDRMNDLIGDVEPVAAADGRAAFALPRAMQAWTNKPAAVAAALAPVAGRLLDSAVPEVERSRVDHRLQEVIARREMHLTSPDRPWAYRKELKSRLMKSVRSVIRQTSAGPQAVQHPEDERRVQFVEALGAATDLTDANLAALEAFAAPYDPMVTPALPGELARLYARRGDRPGALLRCLLAGVHRAPAGDRSVRGVCDALETLRAHPDLIPDAAERYDTTNGLLQVLKSRWELRGHDQRRNGWPEQTGIALHDVAESLAATDDGFALLAGAAAEAGVPDEDRAARQGWLTRSLVRPLRSHRVDVQRTHDARLARVDALATETSARAAMLDEKAFAGESPVAGPVAP